MTQRIASSLTSPGACSTHSQQASHIEDAQSFGRIEVVEIGVKPGERGQIWVFI